MADIHVFPAAPDGTPEAQFVHLHVHSDYSLADGVSKIDTLVARAKQFNMKALALTDHGNMFGALNFYNLCRANGIVPIIGEEFYVAEHDHTAKEKTKFGRKYYHLILLCENATGYKNMMRLSSLAYTEGFYNKPRIDFALLQKYHEGIICLSACLAGQIPQLLLNGCDDEAEEVARRYAELFGPDRYYIELQDHGIPAQKEVAGKLIALARKLTLPLVVTNDVHYCYEEDAEAQDAIRCIGFKEIMTKPHQTMGDGRTEWYLKSEAAMRAILPEQQRAVAEGMANTLKIAAMCRLEIPSYSTQELKNCLPKFPIPHEFSTQEDYMRSIVERGLVKRYQEITPQIRERADYEMGIIFKMGFAGYFLVVWEFINWAKEHDIPIGPGRGSGAGSIVAYAMMITDIDPIRFNLLFERFLNPERISMPDFDVDIDYDFRQDVIQHTRELYGETQVGHIVTFNTLKAKAVITDVGRILEIPLSEVNMLKSHISSDPKTKLIDAFNPPDEKHPDGGGLIPYKDDERYKKLFELSFKLENINRNTGLHASGMVISLTALPDWAPVWKDYKTGEVAVQYTMDIIEPCGLVKMDYLGLKTLSLIRYAEAIINSHRKPGEAELHVSAISETDAATFELFARGDTVAVFQFESPGMQKTLRQAKPSCLEDLIALNALFRPGPMNNIPQFIEGKFHPERIRYPDPCLEDILKETYGVMVYQEQVMQVAQRIAGFSLGAADMLRRAMGKKKLEVLIGKKKEFIEGAVKNGFSAEHAADIFEIMIPFAGYGFNKSHAAAYAVLGYRTGWLKCHYPAEFMAANLTNEISSVDKIPAYIEEARRMGIPVDPPDINRSNITFDVVDGHIVFALCGIKGMGEKAAENIVTERQEHGVYQSFIDFLERVDLHTVNKRALEVLIKTGAFDSFGINRPTLFHNLENAVSYVENKQIDLNNGQEDLFGGTDEKTYADFQFIAIDDAPHRQKLNEERDCIGCYVSGHPLDDYRKAINAAVTLTSRTIDRAAKETQAVQNAGSVRPWQRVSDARRYTVLGTLAALRVIRTKKGDEMAFADLQDYYGTINLTFFSKTWQDICRVATLTDGEIYAFKGHVDISREPPSFIVDAFEPLESLHMRAVQEVHVELERGITTAHDIVPLKDFLFGKSGACTVYFHIDTETGPYIVKGNTQLMVASDSGTIHELKDLPFVKDVWTA